MNLLTTFRNDPFFSGLDLPRALALEHRSSHDNGDPGEIDVFGNPFGMMQSMMNNMGQMFSHIESQMNNLDFNDTNGKGVSFTSSTVMSMDGRNPDQPRIVQATSEKLRGPEGFERTRKAVRDTGRNLEKMEIAHRLGERGHRIIKERDPASGRVLENRELDHIDDENEFERQWFDRAEKFGLKNEHGRSFDASTHHVLPRLRSHSQQPNRLAIEQPSSDQHHSRYKEPKKKSNL